MAISETLTEVTPSLPADPDRGVLVAVVGAALAFEVVILAMLSLVV